MSQLYDPGASTLGGGSSLSGPADARADAALDLLKNLSLSNKENRVNDGAGVPFNPPLLGVGVETSVLGLDPSRSAGGYSPVVNYPTYSPFETPSVSVFGTDSGSGRINYDLASLGGVDLAEYVNMSSGKTDPEVVDRNKAIDVSPFTRTFAAVAAGVPPSTNDVSSGGSRDPDRPASEDAALAAYPPR